jgi:membrane-bound lytic murein transglycosylase A
VVPLKGNCSNRRLKFLGIALFFGFLGLSLAACTPYIKAPTKENAMQRISSFASPAFSDDLDYESLSYSSSQSLAYLQKIPSDRIFVFGEDRFDTAHMIRSLEVFLEYIQKKPSGSELRDFIRSNYRIYRAAGRNGNGEVLYTGYYEPHLRGCLHESPECRFPIYARPDDLITIDLSLFSEKYAGEQIIGRYTDETVVPYYERKEIDNDDVLEDKAEIIAWVKDSVDIFFLQIQGSGKVYLDNGQVINVHYHTSNGRPYRSIGKLLIDEGKIPPDQMSMQKIRAYLLEHPEEVETVLNYNPSYVFFKIEPDGPLGNINVKLTPGRSIALDRRLFPPAALAFIKTQKPLIDAAGNIDDWTDCTRFALNQDTGGAIIGPGRADLFWGNGVYAEIAAGYLHHPGKLYFLILKPKSR